MLMELKAGFLKIPNWLKALVLISLILGIFLRFYNLDGKLYSNDEAFSTTYIYGQNIANIIDVKIVSASELQNYQRYNTDEGIFDSFKRLLERPYVFPPLYAFMVQIWSRFWSLFLTEPAIITRSCSAFISLFSLPFMYWLCWELFQSASIAWLGTAIFAISPLQLQYSQIVRTYSLITAFTLLSSATLLHSLRVPKKINWLLYTFTVAFGLYSNIIFAFVIISHALYIIIDSRGRITKNVKNYILSSLLGISLFMPWFYLFLTKPGLVGYSVGQPAAANIPITGLIKDWMRGVLRIFIDLNDGWIKETDSFLLLQRTSWIFLLVFLLTSVVFLIFNAGKNKNWMILALLIGGGGILMIKDAISGTGFSVRLRYMLPYAIGWQLAATALIAYLFYSRLSWQRQLSKIIISSLLLLGLLSSWIIASSPSWWAFGAPDYPAIAQKLNKLEKPVVLYDDFADALTMSYLVNHNVYSHLTRRAEFHLENNPNQPNDIYRGYTDIIIFRPSSTLVEKLQSTENFVLEPLFKSQENYPSKPNAWKVIKR
ncbi:hypothetical protein MiAbW_00272 [Microcystis aeruginosa NIES-4325]|uniref:Uncharacterized protein n=1 Tax=Microcystis aeruginosa NIES-4325 TaxID=2569534 RepID=A0A5J4F5C4_MICAE|nr:hypothetical protein MiAbW_00272 [Microcystis aeruginosa NIES-4325]